MAPTSSRAKPMRVGVVAMGYADGYPRQAPTGTPVLVAGQRSQLIGRVSMDMLCIDLTDVPQAGLGRPSSCGASNVLASEVAAAADTIPYQIFCNLRRVPRLYSGVEPGATNRLSEQVQAPSVVNTERCRHDNAQYSYNLNPGGASIGRR